MNTRKADGKLLQFRSPAAHLVGTTAGTHKLKEDAAAKSSPEKSGDGQSEPVSRCNPQSFELDPLWRDSHIRAHFPNQRADGTFDNGPQPTQNSTHRPQQSFWQRVLTALDIPWNMELL